MNAPRSLQWFQQLAAQNAAGGGGDASSVTFTPTTKTSATTVQAAISEVANESLRISDNDFVEVNPPDQATLTLPSGGILTIRLTNTALVNIAGIEAGVVGRIVLIANASSTNSPIILRNSSVNASAANRFNLGGDITLGQRGHALFMYDGTSWRLLTASYHEANTTYTGTNTYNGQVTFGSTSTFSSAVNVNSTMVYNRTYVTLNASGSIATPAVLLVGLTPATSGLVLQGIGAPGVIARPLYLKNTGTNSFTISNEDATASPSNRILTANGTDLIVPPSRVIHLLYESSNNRWHQV